MATASDAPVSCGKESLEVNFWIPVVQFARNKFKSSRFRLPFVPANYAGLLFLTSHPACVPASIVPSDFSCT